MDKKFVNNKVKKIKRLYATRIIENIELNFVNIYEKLKDENSFYYENCYEDNKEEIAYIGRKPIFEIKECDGKYIKFKDSKEIFATNKIEELDKVIDEFSIKIDDYDFYYGGYFGYVGYDAALDYLNIENKVKNIIKMPKIHLIDPSEVLIYLKKQKKVIIIVYSVDKETQDFNKFSLDKLDYLENIICNKTILNSEEIKKNQIQIIANDNLDSYSLKVKKVKEYIENGDIFQAVPSQRKLIKGINNSLEIFKKMKIINKSPYMYYLNFKEGNIYGASPELLVKLKRNKYYSCPIAGTRKRGKDLIEDLALERELLNDEKENAEHIMLVDLARNDLGKISKVGSVKVSNFKEIKKFSHVMHITSIVIGEKDNKFSRFKALLNCLPAGTVSGAPKKRAMEIISEVEKENRGIYGGAICCFPLNGEMDTCIAIRTIIENNNINYLQAGGGVVYDSNAKFEFNETNQKMKVLIESIKEGKDDNNNR